jgi:hypothetical protein
MAGKFYATNMITSTFFEIFVGDRGAHLQYQYALVPLAVVSLSYSLSLYFLF